MPWFGKSKSTAPDRLARNLNEAETRYLQALRRELSNLLISIDPDLMVRAFDRAEAYESEIRDNHQRAVAEEAALVAKFPMFSDFDLIGTRHFVPYGDAWGRSDEALAEGYHDVSRMLMFMRRREEYRPDRPLYDEDERRVLKSSMERERDRRLRTLIDEAMGRFYAFRQGLERQQGEFAHSFADRDFEVVRLATDFTPEIQYGVVCKGTGEHAVFGFYVHDHDDGISNYYYRSEASFRTQTRLSVV